VIVQILASCGLSASPETREPDASYVGLGPGETDRTRPIDAYSLSKWKELLNPQQEADILDIAGETARSFGYE